jgi:tRNA dimethylallyltransferase
VSADSRQVYRGLDVGTAKPTAAQRARVPHHCLDLAEPDEPFDAARFRAAALAAIGDVEGRGRRALVVGGTGLYVRALVHGLCAAPPRQPALRRALEAIAARDGVPALHRRLVEVDPAAARRIHPNDAVRTVRALEVALASGRRLSEWQAAHGFAEAGLDALVIGLALPTPVLDAHIAARVDDMLARGFVDEVRRLAARRYAADSPVWRTLGYAELRAHLEGRLTLDAAREAIVRATRRFAKRQRTWFRRAEGMRWRHPVDDAARLGAETEAFLAGAHIAKAEGPE